MTAWLRLLLALMVLTLAPAMAPAAGPTVVSPAVAAGDHECGHFCDGMAVDDHSGAACPACAAPMVVPPLAIATLAQPPRAALERVAPVDLSCSSTRWPPPLRPPRAAFA